MAGNHTRETTSMQNSLRCGAKTRSGTPCKSPAVAGKNAAVCMEEQRVPVLRLGMKIP
jgi:hypothetical protein